MIGIVLPALTWCTCAHIMGLKLTTITDAQELRRSIDQADGKVGAVLTCGT